MKIFGKTVGYWFLLSNTSMADIGLLSNDEVPRNFNCPTALKKSVKVNESVLVDPKTLALFMASSSRFLSPSPFNKALVCSKNVAALALLLSWRICARAHAQFFRDPALVLALKTF